MPTHAFQGFSKIMQACPQCHDNDPKELVGIAGSDQFQARCGKCGRLFTPARPLGCVAKIALAIGLLFAIGLVSLFFQHEDQPAVTIPAATVTKAESVREARPRATPTSSNAERNVAAVATPRALPTGPAVDAAKQRAIAAFPELGVAGSKLNAAFVVQVRKAQRERPEIFDEAEWPTILAKEALLSIPAR